MKTENIYAQSTFVCTKRINLLLRVTVPSVFDRNQYNTAEWI